MKIGNLDLRVPKPAPISQAPRSRKIALAVVACIALFFLAKPMALLLWARIRILTSLPKTAIAEPMESSSTTSNLPKEFDPNLPSWHADVHDPFQVDSQVFPDPKPVEAAGETRESPRGQTADRAHETPGAGTTPSGEVEPTVSEDGDSAAPALYETLRASAESVRVQSAGAGLQGAVIDDKALRIGDTVRTADGTEFTLVAVLDGAVVLAFDGREFVVSMPKLPPNAPVKPSPKGGGGKP